MKLFAHFNVEMVGNLLNVSIMGLDAVAPYLVG